MEIKLPTKIKELTDGLPYHEDEVGCSDSRVLIYDRMVLKIERCSPMVEKQNTMLSWLKGKLPAPEIICSEASDAVNYLLMTRIGGKMSCEREYMTQPKVVIPALAEAVKMLWSVDIADCPIRNTIENMLADAEKHIAETDISQWHGTFETPAKQLEWLKAHRHEDDFVFSHGDCCMPNVMLENGHVSGFIDMAQCGAADRWYDVALCVQSMERNSSGFFGGIKYDGYDREAFFSSLGIAPDEEKIKFHLLLDELFSI